MDSCHILKGVTQLKKKNNKPGVEIRDNPFPPPMLDSYPTNQRVDIDPATNGTAPTDESVRQAKRWVDYNIR